MLPHCSFYPYGIPRYVISYAFPDDREGACVHNS